MAEGDVKNSSMEAHVRTYGRLIAMFKVGLVGVGIIAALVIYLISR